MKTNATPLLLALLCLSGHAVGQTTVYLDTFDDDGVAVNTNAGGGGASMEFNGGGGTNWGWTDGEDVLDSALSAGTGASGNRIAIFNSNSSFNIDQGFTLEVTFDMEGNGITPFPANHFSLGLTAVSGTDTSDGNLLQSNNFVPTYDAIGFSLGTRNNNVDMGLLEWDADGAGATGTTTTLSLFDFTAGVTTQTVSLTVASDGSYSYSYDDATGGGLITGTGTTNIDLSQPYYFKVRTQASSGNALQSVSLMTDSAQQITAPTISSTSSLIESGDSVDLDITFDTASDSVTLTTPTESIDLIDLDSGDAMPGDGMVVVTDSPTSTYTYVVEASETGETPKSASVEVLVVDPSTEPANNAFSTAIKNDSPLFYYRFEEAADSGYLLDSSGNGYHSDGLVGAFTQGASSGGMQLAGRSDLTAGILVPASSEMSASFTLVAVLNADGVTGGALRNVFSMANDGIGGIGRSILYYGNGGFESFISGSTIDISDGDALPAEMSCLIHLVFDADPDEDPLIDDQEFRLFVNGQPYGTPVLVGAVAANFGEWVLCSNKNLGSQAHVGFLDEAAVFESELSDAQIAAHGAAFFAAADPLLGFVSDATEITIGGSVTLSWKISDQAAAVTINGVDQGITTGNGGVYTTVVSPTADTTYEIAVTGPGGPFTRMIDVTVLVPPVITSISADGETPPNITIEILGAENTTYNISASGTLEDGFPTPVDTVMTDGTGFGSKTFPGYGLAEFYRLELP